jgi:hypothetical protein
MGPYIFIFTFLIFRQPNQITIDKNKTIHFIGIRHFDPHFIGIRPFDPQFIGIRPFDPHCIGIRPFDPRLYLDISRSFKCPKCSPMVCLICNYLRSFVAFC